MDSTNNNITFSFQQIINAVKQLSPKEKLLLSDVIWEDDIEIPIEHQKLVLDRMEKSRINPARRLDWDESTSRNPEIWIERNEEN